MKSKVSVNSLLLLLRSTNNYYILFVNTIIKYSIEPACLFPTRDYIDDIICTVSVETKKINN